MIDGGGSALKWLFGVATQADLAGLNKKISGLTRRENEIVHLMDHQATVVNESLWEIRTNTKLIQELEGQTAELTKNYNNLLGRMAERQAYMIEYFDFFINLDTAFESVEASLQWLRDLADALDEGLDLLANGRLAPQIFPPAQMALVLKAVNRQLPLGWAVSSDELWVTYREAMVTVAAVEGRFRLFIKIPIYDHAQQYNLFEIFSLPRATDNGTHGVIIGYLPKFLAVSTDLETFIELSTDDIQGSKKLERLICNFHTGLGKRGARKSCAISLFTNDANRKLTQCRQQFKEWKGSEVAYLGENRWAFSAITAHEVVFSCPIGSSQGPPQSLQLPPFGIFDVPPGCTAKTEDWIFPASLEGRLEASLDPLVAPTLAAVGFNITTFKSVAIIELPKANTTSINFISDLLRRNDGARASSEMTGFQIQELMKKTTEEFQLTESRYLFELLVLLLLLVVATTFLSYQTVWLRGRMRAHEHIRHGDPRRPLPPGSGTGGGGVTQHFF